MKKDLSKHLNIIKEKRVNSIAVELTLVIMLKHVSKLFYHGRILLSIVNDKGA